MHSETRSSSPPRFQDHLEIPRKIHAPIGKKRGKYNNACDVCHRKYVFLATVHSITAHSRRKIKCHGGQPTCRPCLDNGRAGKVRPLFLCNHHDRLTAAQCAWTKTLARKPRTEQHFESLQKMAQIERERAEGLMKYVFLLESLVDQCHRHHSDPHLAHDFRQSRPANFENARPIYADPPQDDLVLEFVSQSHESSDTDEIDDQETSLGGQELKVSFVCSNTSSAHCPA